MRPIADVYVLLLYWTSFCYMITHELMPAESKRGRHLHANFAKRGYEIIQITGIVAARYTRGH